MRCAHRWARLPSPALLATALLLPALQLAAQGAPLTVSDSALVGRVLQAEDRADPRDPALAQAAAHTDPRLRALATRARARMSDPRFAARDSIAPVVPAWAPPVYPEPAWRLRFRALAGARNDCTALTRALTDDDWRVRLRSADLLGPPCASTSEDAVAELTRWISTMPTDVSRRAKGNVSWHAAAHAVVALARIAPASARPHLERLATHPSPWLRAYLVRAATALGDSARLRRFVADSDPNVRAEAVEALARITGHADDLLWSALVADHTAAQVVRVAANALAGTSRRDLASIAGTAYERRWRTRTNDSERDVRQALLRAAGRDTAEEASVRQPRGLAPATLARAVSLALGADVRLRVTMADASGGGTFTVRLRGDQAPLMAARIAQLAESGWYDGRTWHRVEHDFVLQGGSPSANEYVGHHTFLRDELGTIAHPRGTVGMSTRGHDTGDAQWFVNLRDNARLARDYTVFAEVVEGIDVVDDVLEGDVIARIQVVR
jgi:cyclophilin family peptidyl-prolyl cis-trans isomerase